jgi:hypothetical protein
MREGADEPALPESRHKPALERTRHSLAVFGHVAATPAKHYPTFIKFRAPIPLAVQRDRTTMYQALFSGFL